MNSSIKHNKQFFSLLLGLLLNSFLHAITFDNEGRVFFTSLPNNNVTILEIENGNLNIKHEWNKNFTKKELKKEFKKKRARSIRLKTFDTSCTIISHKNSHIIEEYINLQSKTLLRLTNCFLEASVIEITGDWMFFENCFLINPEVLYLSTNCPSSDYQSIKIVFHDQPAVPTLLTGNVDFIDSHVKKTLYLTNVKEITIKDK